MRTLPIYHSVQELKAKLENQTRLVIIAPPGAGKTTAIPPLLLESAWLQGRKIIMLEPRRLAARNAARRMAYMHGEAVGQSFGYRTRLDSAVSSQTRIEVVTEGVFLRMIQASPELEGIGCVIFDEFHERNINSDLALSLALDAQAGLCENVRLIAMSATPNEGIVRIMGDCPVLASQGQSWPVNIYYRPAPSTSSSRQRQEIRDQNRMPYHMEQHVAASIRYALKHYEGGLLAFLPGIGEIRRVASLLNDLENIHILHSNVSPEAQDAAIQASPTGARKIVLSTAIAETSLTLADISIVIDSGWTRSSRFDVATGMSRLVSLPISKDIAEQRAGRAGRLEEGVCYRLWSQAEDQSLRQERRPEIMESDLASFLLELSAWGVSSLTSLAWMDLPPQSTVLQATELLAQLGAWQDSNKSDQCMKQKNPSHNTEVAIPKLSNHGKCLASIPLHPRLAHMVLQGHALGLGTEALVLAALLEEGTSRQDEFISDAFAELYSFMHQLHAKQMTAKDVKVQSKQKRLAASISTVARHAKITIKLSQTAPVECVGALLAFAYPERIAQSMGSGVFRMVNGKRAAFPYNKRHESLAKEAFIAIGECHSDANQARIWQAAPLAKEYIETHFSQSIIEQNVVTWHSQSESVVARKERKIGAVILDSKEIEASHEDLQAALMQGIRELAINALPWTEKLRQWQERLLFLYKLDTNTGTTQGTDCLWPNVCDANLQATLEDWLGPYLISGAGRHGQMPITRRAHFQYIKLDQALHSILSYEQSRQLDILAPSHIEVPSGSRIAILYGQEGGPILAVKLQELFGLEETPRIAGGQAPLLIHLLSPAGRPLQVTRDLASFWRNGYQAVRAEMRGRYPKHPWPENPLTATASRHTNKKQISSR